ncbi:vWA domain-containing protein [Photobacterium nomapromontoriensis]|uniref:vWA domain-containing protein n=1 Tax=Photobacterium nomapromontoriensis TaxID=2910237 RepID=UPI003D11CFB9
MNPSLSKASVTLMLSEPFYGHYLASLQKQILTKGDINSSTLNSFFEPVLEIRLHGTCDVELVCHLEHWQTLNAQQQVGALKHEALHLVLGHIFQRGNYADKSRFDLAADLVVNQYLLPVQLLPHSVTLDGVNQYLDTQGQPRLAPFREVNYYYQAIISLPIESCFSESQLNQSQHKSWGAVCGQTQAQQGLLEQQLIGKLENAAQRTELCHVIGSLPAAIVAILEQVRLARNPVLNWRRSLRLFANSSRRTSVKNTLRRPSKRYGTTPGIKIQPHQRLLVAVDTSASVDDEQLQLFFEEVHHIWRAGAEITIAECDTVIKRQYIYRGIAPSNIIGRGGTDFDEPIILANQQRFDGTIYFTDGEASAPTVKPRKPLLWLIHSGEGKQAFDHLQHSGRVIPMIIPTSIATKR